MGRIPKRDGRRGDGFQPSWPSRPPRLSIPTTYYNGLGAGIHYGSWRWAEIHPLDVHPFLDFGPTTIATTLLKRGRGEKRFRPLRLDHVLIGLSRSSMGRSPKRDGRRGDGFRPPTRIRYGFRLPNHCNTWSGWSEGMAGGTTATIATALLKRVRDGYAIPGNPSRPRFCSGCAIVVGEKSEKGWTSR